MDIISATILRTLRRSAAWLMLLLAAATGTGAASAQSDAYFLLVDSASMAIDRREWADAERYILSALRSEPSSPSNVLLLSNLGIIQWRMGRDSIALATLSDAHRIAPRSVVVLANRALVSSSCGLDSAAYSDYTLIIGLDPEYAGARFGRGMIALARNDTATAAADFAVLERLEPDSRDTHMALAALYTATALYDKALPHYSSLIAIEPSDEFYLGRAICRMASGMLSEAGEDIAAGLKLNPANAELYAQRALLNRMRYRPAEYEADMKRAAELGYRPAPAAHK